MQQRSVDDGVDSLDGRKPRHFHRVQYGGSPDSAFLLSSKTLRHIDLRAADHEMMLYSLAGSTSTLTSLDQRLTTPGAYQSPLMGFSSTEAVSWVDIRMPGRAVVQWEHGRAFDRSLQLISVETGEGPSHASRYRWQDSRR